MNHGNDNGSVSNQDGTNYVIAVGRMVNFLLGFVEQ